MNVDVYVAERIGISSAYLIVIAQFTLLVRSSVTTLASVSLISLIVMLMYRYQLADSKLIAFPR